MTNVITYTDFTGEFRIDTGAANSGETAKLTLYITQFQEELLMKLFGRNLYAFFDTPIDLDPLTYDPKWTEIKDAQTTYYEYNGIKYKYPGLKRILVSYVYFHWNRLETSSSTPQGETRSTSTNGEAVYNDSKQVNAWNEAQRLYYEVVNYILYKNSLTPDYFADFDYDVMEKINSFGI